MPVTFGNVDLTPPPFALAEVERWWHVHRIVEAEHPAFLQGGLHHLPLPYAPRREPPRIGVLHWPNSASRWATCHLLATGGQLELLQSLSGSPHALVFSDGTNSVTASMYRLPARPVSQRGDGRELYLITLVDERYYWWVGNGEPPTSDWSALIESLFSDAGGAGAVEAVAGDYQQPNEDRWKLKDQPTPILIDAACRMVGRRVVRTLAGAASAVSYATAAALDDGQWEEFEEQCMAGGRATAEEVGLSVPASVEVRWPGSDRDPTSLTLTELALAPYGASVGRAGRSGAWNADPAGDDIEDDEADSYAAQAAEDYYLWQLSLTDATFRGIRNWSPTGLEDAVEWVWDADGYATRVLRSPLHDPNVWGDQFTELFAPQSGSGSGSGSGGGDGNASCERSVKVGSVVCEDGVRKIRLKYLDIGRDSDGRLVVEDCFEEEYRAGPCGESDTTRLPVVTKVCPAPCGDAVGDVIIKPTADYGDCFLPADGSSFEEDDFPALYAVYSGTLPTLSNPASGLSYYVRAGSPAPVVSRKLVTVPVAEAAEGCVQFAEEDCCSGSGSGGNMCGPDECITGCPPCDLMSSQWEFVDPETSLPVLLCAIADPDDGNHCRFASEDWRWELFYLPTDGLWLLLNYDTGQVFYIDAEDWSCLLMPNVMADLYGGHDVTVSPVFDCTEESFYCFDGDCVAVAGTGGPYATVEECLAAGCGSGSGGGGGDPGCLVNPNYCINYGHDSGIGTGTMGGNVVDDECRWSDGSLNMYSPELTGTPGRWLIIYAADGTTWEALAWSGAGAKAFNRIAGASGAASFTVTNLC